MEEKIKEFHFPQASLMKVWLHMPSGPFVVLCTCVQSCMCGVHAS